MNLRDVEVVANTLLDKYLFMAMKAFQRIFHRAQGGCGLHLKARVHQEVQNRFRGGSNLGVDGTNQYCVESLRHLLALVSRPLRDR